ncbi:HSP20-like chaperones superfamily protein [Wolffia australiana]
MEIQYSGGWPFARLRVPQNHVRWVETAESHLFSVDFPGMRMEDMRVEVEDARYLIIRTEIEEGQDGEAGTRAREFMRKFRLPERVDVERISATYEDGVLTVTVPRLHSVWSPLLVRPSDGDETGRKVLARAA